MEMMKWEMLRAKRTRKPLPQGFSPPQKKAKRLKPVDPDKVVDGAKGPEFKGRPSLVSDTGGSGDCGWRALSFAVCGINNPSLTDEQIMEKLPKLAKTMQAKIVSFVSTNRKLWWDAWTVDKNTNKTMEDGDIPQNQEQYLQAIKRPHRWVDGMLLAAAALAQKINITVWQFKKNRWLKIAVSPCWRWVGTITSDPPHPLQRTLYDASFAETTMAKGMGDGH